MAAMESRCPALIARSRFVKRRSIKLFDSRKTFEKESATIYDRDADEWKIRMQSVAVVNSSRFIAS